MSILSTNRLQEKEEDEKKEVQQSLSPLSPLLPSIFNSFSSPLTNTSLLSSLNLQTLPPVSLAGISLRYLQDEFIAQCGGRNALENKSTTDLCNQYILPITQPYQCSFCDLLQAHHHYAYHHTADVFISHAWSYKFLDVIDILCDHFQGQDDVVIWFDVFSNNQHHGPMMDHNWWQTIFHDAMAKIGYMVMVLSPWEDPEPLKRAWCCIVHMIRNVGLR
jgi:hypothetical protein